jgi:hypothetical protein
VGVGQGHPHGPSAVQKDNGAQIDDLFAADRDLYGVLEDVARLGARLILPAALEAESATVCPSILTWTSRKCHTHLPGRSGLSPGRRRH